MHQIAVLSQNQDTGQQIAIWTKEYCGADGLFPQIVVYEDLEQFYQNWQATNLCAVIVNLPGVAGLNEVEHIRSLSSGCGLIWCSDLDFSLHAFRMRADFFILSPVSRQSLCEGLSICIENRNYQHEYEKGSVG